MNIDNIKCLNDNVLVRLEEDPKQSTGGIALVKEQRTRWARVLDTGVRQPTGVVVGDRVLVDTLTTMAKPLPIDGQENLSEAALDHLMVKPIDILVVEET